MYKNTRLLGVVLVLAAGAALTLPLRQTGARFLEQAWRRKYR